MASVTVGMPVYNGAAYLDNALKSLFNQTFRDFEILISDNGSTDATAEIVRKWASVGTVPLTYYRHEKTVPIMDNFESLLIRSKTKWFMFAAYDDQWSENYVEALFHKITSGPDIVMAAPATTEFGEGSTGKHIGYLQAFDGWNSFQKVRYNLQTVRSSWLYGMMNREAFLNALVQAKKFKPAWSNDFIILLILLLTGKVTGDDSAIYYRRETGISESRYKPKTIMDQAKHYFAFLRESLRALFLSELSTWEKIRLVPEIFAYVNYHGWNFKNLIARIVRMK